MALLQVGQAHASPVNATVTNSAAVNIMIS